MVPTTTATVLPPFAIPADILNRTDAIYNVSFNKRYQFGRELTFSPGVTIFARSYHFRQELPFSPSVTIFAKSYHILQELPYFHGVPFLPRVTIFATTTETVLPPFAIQADILLRTDAINNVSFIKCYQFGR
jgi:hypothetical protein